MVQLETDYSGSDFTLNLKAMNPSITEGPLTGMFVGDYLQAVTPRLALGIEAMMQRPSADEGPTTMLAYAARYKSKDWILSGQLLQGGAINTSYWRRLSDRVEAGIDLNLQFAGLSGSSMMGQPGNEGVAVLGAKYDFRMATFRGQIDSKGKVSCVLEKMVSPPVQLTFAGELDHAKVSCSSINLEDDRQLTTCRTPPKSGSVYRCKALTKRWPRKRRDKVITCRSRRRPSRSTLHSPIVLRLRTLKNDRNQSPNPTRTTHHSKTPIQPLV